MSPVVKINGTDYDLTLPPPEPFTLPLLPFTLNPMRNPFFPVVLLPLAARRFDFLIRFFCLSRADNSPGVLYPPRFPRRAPFDVLLFPVSLFNPAHIFSPAQEAKIIAAKSRKGRIRLNGMRNFMSVEDTSKKKNVRVHFRAANNCCTLVSEMQTVTVEGGPIWLYLFGKIIEFLLVIAFMVIWLVSMSRALKACSPMNRRMDPGSVWLVFVPLFGLVWQFICVKNTSESLAQEYYGRGWKSDEGRPGIEIGMIACSVAIIVLLVRMLMPGLHPALSFFMSLAVCMCMFMHRDRLNAFVERIDKERVEIPFYFPFEQQARMENPFSQQQFQQPVQPAQPVPVVQRNAPGWDGTTTWAPPANWTAPDLTDMSQWIS